MQPKTTEFRHMYYYSPNVHRRQITYTPKTSHFKLWVFFVALIAVVTGTIAWFPAPKSSSPQAAAVLTPQKVAATPEPVVPAISEKEMADRINAIINANPDVDIGVAMTDLKTGKTYRYGLQVVFEAASIGKLITAADYLRQVERDERKLTDPVNGGTAAEQIRLMLEKSDNPSWLAMNKVLGPDSLRAYARSIGMKTYDPDKNYIAVDDINTLVSKLYQGKLLNRENTNRLLAHMKIANQADYIPPAVPRTIDVYHKTGLLEDRVHDAAIIDNGKRPYSLVIFTNGQKRYHPTKRTDLFQQITKVTLGYFVDSKYLN